MILFYLTLGSFIVAIIGTLVLAWFDIKNRRK